MRILIAVGKKKTYVRDNSPAGQGGKNSVALDEWPCNTACGTWGLSVPTNNTISIDAYLATLKLCQSIRGDTLVGSRSTSYFRLCLRILIAGPCDAMEE